MVVIRHLLNICMALVQSSFAGARGQLSREEERAFRVAVCSLRQACQ